MADISPAAIGGTLHIRDVTYIIIAVRDNDLLLLEKSEDGAPVQYVVAHGVYQNNGELCWLNGDYFPIPLYPDTVAAIKDAIAHLTEGGMTIMNFSDRGTVERVRAMYPPGTRIELLEMRDPQAPPHGTRGTVRAVDDTASLITSWDGGHGSLNVIYGVDRVRIVRPDEPE